MPDRPLRASLWHTLRDPGRGRHMRRREFITLLGSAAATCPLGARAQQSDHRVPRIGFLGSATAAGSTKALDALRMGLREFGYVEGRNIVIEFRWAEGRYERLPQLVRELIATPVDLLITHGTPGTRAAKLATSTIPIVMAISGDAVATGLVSSLARPEANVTGSTFFLPELNAKRLEVLKEACPNISHPTALSNPENPVSKPIIPAMQLAATALTLTLGVARAQGPSDFDRAFETMAGDHVDSVVVTEDGEFAPNFRTIAALALQKRLPSIGAKEYGEAGGLVGYGVNILALYRRAAYFVERILKGANPADLPVEQPTRFELTVNRRTAKALGLGFSATLLARADEVIE
jgi:putative tryptophan/tyrosine transport system substrate-binding protein